MAENEMAVRPQEVRERRTTLIVIIILKITKIRKRRLFIRFVFNTELSPEKYWRGPRAQEVAVTTRLISALKMESDDERHYNVSFVVVRGKKAQDGVHKPEHF